MGARLRGFFDIRSGEALPVFLTFLYIAVVVAACLGQRAVTVVTLLFFAANVLLFWWLFRRHPFALLPGVFYVWVNCFGIIAPVQAWSFANSQFDTRQAKRLFGLIGAGASFGAILGGLLARVLVRRVGGAINLLLVPLGLILAAAAVVAIANAKIPPRGLARRGKPHRHP